MVDQCTRAQPRKASGEGGWGLMVGVRGKPKAKGWGDCTN